jgi:hypothetical protein
MATLLQASAVSEESTAMDIGNRKVSVSATARDVVASNSLSFLELHARRPEIESAAITVLFDIMTSNGGSGGLSATTISLTAHCPCDQLCRNRYCCFQCVLTPSLTRFPSSNHLDNRDEWRKRSVEFASLIPGIREARGRTNFR